MVSVSFVGTRLVGENAQLDGANMGGVERSLPDKLHLGCLSEQLVRACR